ncbi:hypothetical protein Aduo_001747 [Ancylostoma duodenale]
MSFHDFLFNLQLQQFFQQLYTTNRLLAQNPADFYRDHDPVPALPLQVDQLPPGLYSAPHPSARQLDVPAPKLAPTCAGCSTSNSSRNRRCYVFQYQKKTSRGDTLIYRCFECRHQNGNFTSVHVMDDVFHSDPCRLPHTCLPLDRYGDKAERVTYKNVHFSKPFRRRDQIHRQKFIEEMANFRAEYEGSTHISTETVSEYCCTMSCCVTENTV